jgi:hypothetical protein
MLQIESLAVVDECVGGDEGTINRSELLKQLGLPSDNGYNPYPIVSAVQAFCLENLFPVSTELNSDCKVSIPDRVLNEVVESKCILSEVCEGVEFTYYVLAERNATVIDPWVVASERKIYQWGEPDYSRVRLVARWGEALMSWQELISASADFAKDRANKLLSILTAEVKSGVVDRGCLNRLIAATDRRG